MEGEESEKEDKSQFSTGMNSQYRLIFLEHTKLVRHLVFWLKSDDYSFTGYYDYS